MKILKTTLLALTIALAGTSVSQAQSRKDKVAAKEAAMQKILESKNFTFTAQTANPMRGGNVNLTAEYDVRITGDSVISYLPYYGRAYVAPMNPTQNDMQFTSTKFTYASTAKKGGYEIVIKPTDTKDVRQMILNVSNNGYGTLSVTNLNRDPISFYGFIEENKKPKQ
ncbi:DUF4251 domain-containing protein [Mucilaginibacter mali]|uniref:DUF4251 domain-containing protein n=1 Tax=Mucilaginibacter mali TaxID=2740462 RepID=A0A7D4QAP5_9SPHI|nr:DUF4251 domain-containing protein [Mucilaginibacter mali]QKJ30104.1 DUF4251 domain-containing protein [Mucilaginibacter mali]